jgi:hypothetical protein
MKLQMKHMTHCNNKCNVSQLQYVTITNLVSSDGGRTTAQDMAQVLNSV